MNWLFWIFLCGHVVTWYPLLYIYIFIYTCLLGSSPSLHTVQGLRSAHCWSIDIRIIIVYQKISSLFPFIMYWAVLGILSIYHGCCFLEFSLRKDEIFFRENLLYNLFQKAMAKEDIFLIEHARKVAECLCVCCHPG